MTAITWTYAMNPYPETKGEETGEVSFCQDFGLVLLAALFAGIGFAVLIFAAWRL